MLPNTELIEIIRAKPLVANSTTYLGPEFQLGEGWVRLHLRIQYNLTHGTGSGALSEGELLAIKGIFFKTDKGEIIANNVPGRLLYRVGQAKMGTAPIKDAIAAVTGTYNVPIDIWFSDPRLAAEEQHETILDTSRYSSLQLGITMGGIADLLGTPGTDTVSMTADVYIERVKGILPPEMRPDMYVTYGVFAPQNPLTGNTYVDLEKSENLAYKRVQVHTVSGATAGAPMYGTAADQIINDLDVEATEKFAFQNILADVLKRQNNVDYQLEAMPAGVHTVSFVDKSKSLLSVLKSGGQSRLRVNWRNFAGLAGTPQVTVGYEGIRPLAGN